MCSVSLRLCFLVEVLVRAVHLVEGNRIGGGVAERVRATERTRCDGERPDRVAVSRLQNGLEVGIARGDGKRRHPPFSGESGRVDREFHVDVAACHDHFEAAGLRSLYQTGGGVLVEIQPCRHELPLRLGRLPDIVEVDIELLA